MQLWTKYVTCCQETKDAAAVPDCRIPALDKGAYQTTAFKDPRLLASSHTYNSAKFINLRCLFYFFLINSNLLMFQLPHFSSKTAV